MIRRVQSGILRKKAPGMGLSIKKQPNEGREQLLTRASTLNSALDQQMKEAGISYKQFVKDCRKARAEIRRTKD